MKRKWGGRRGQVFVVHNMEEFGQDISSSIRTSYFWGFELLHGILFNKIFWTLTYWKIVVIKWQIYQSQIFKLTNSLFVLPNLKHLELVHSTLFLKLIQFKKTNLFFFLSRTVAENPKHSTQSTSWSLIWEFIPRKSHTCVK